MDEYAQHDCIVCHRAAVGYATNLVYKKWYCNAHWSAVGTQVDKWLKEREQAQWGDKLWYQLAMAPKPRKARKSTAKPKTKQPVPLQLKI